MLAVVRASLCVDWTSPAWIEDELVRRGARDARMIDHDIVSVKVAASSRRDAEEQVRDLLARVGATEVMIVGEAAREHALVLPS